MKNFILKRQPKAYQGSKTFKTPQSRANFISDLENAIRQHNSLDNLLKEDLYAIVYYFQKRKTGTDADNISKPIWDCLKGILFEDDKQIKLRTAGIIDISKGDLNIVDFSSVGGKITVDLLEAMETNDHIVYIECGSLNNSLYKFNMEANGN